MDTVLKWAKQVDVWQAIVAGLCLGSGFIFPSFWWLGIGGVLFVLHAMQSELPLRKVVMLVTVVWGIKSLCSLVWFWSAYPIGWVEGLGSSSQIILIAAYWLTSALWLASGGAFFTIASLLIRNVLRKQPLGWLCAVPFLWLGSELLATILFSVCTAGPGSFLQTYFSFGMVGYLLGTTPGGVWVAGVAGVYGLTIIFVAMAASLYVVITTQRFRWCIVACLIGSLGSLYPGPTPVVVNTGNTVISVDTQFDAGFATSDSGYVMKADILEKAVTHALRFSPEVIVLPEDSRYLENYSNDSKPEQAMSNFQLVHTGTDALVIDSGRHVTEQGVTVLRATIFDGIAKQVWQFDKQYLVPQGEYVPFVYGALLRLIGYGEIVDAVARNSAYQPGPKLQTTAVPDYVPGVLFCFESVNPIGVGTLAQSRKMTFVAHPMSHAWFHSSELLWQQLDVMLQIQARANGVPIVSAGNMVAGKLYLPSGHIQTGAVIGSGEHYLLRKFVF